MSRARRYRSLVMPTAFALAFAMIATACGGSTKNPASGSAVTTTAPASSGSSTTTPDQTARIMKSGLLRATDVPSAWRDSGTSSASASDQTQIELAKTIPQCRDFADTVTRERQLVKVSSNIFVDATAPPQTRGEVSNDVVAWPSVADAKAAYGVYSASTMKSCLSALFGKLVAQQAATSGVKATISVDDLLAPAVGDASIGYQAVASLTSAAVTQQIAFVIEIVRVNRYTVSYNATLYKAAPTEFGKNLIERSIARIKAP